MFDRTKKAVKNLVNTPVPIAKTVLVTGVIVVGAFLLTHKMKVILVFG